VANGVRLGRKPTLTHHQQQEAIKRLKAGKETQGEIGRFYNVSRWTISSTISSRSHQLWGLGRVSRKFLAIIGPNLRTTDG
jgi:hypothetical protein